MVKSDEMLPSGNNQSSINNRVKCRPKPALKSGWTRWQQPVMTGYMMQCCDCGMIHEMEFGVLRKGKNRKNGYWGADKLDHNKYRVEFRVRRTDGK